MSQSKRQITLILHKLDRLIQMQVVLSVLDILIERNEPKDEVEDEDEAEKEDLSELVDLDCRAEEIVVEADETLSRVGCFQELAVLGLFRLDTVKIGRSYGYA